MDPRRKVSTWDIREWARNELGAKPRILWQDGSSAAAATVSRSGEVWASWFSGESDHLRTRFNLYRIEQELGTEIKQIPPWARPGYLLQMIPYGDSIME
ncbi:hypothetical protein J5N97_023116 [Dioscorea zingiberensis]|uniref:Uncharacterized protein n=1 Tax=Dioscorea zingiberensis TaxID=325984 RepID=A0A9D5CC67_9LILI|nr:hypothetical protein J5N97_023116 [Dioscorea zingiberensis]